MSRLIRRSRCASPWLLCLLLLLACFPAWAQDDTRTTEPEPATLRWANRDIAVFRGLRSGIEPVERASRAVKALNRLDDADRLLAPRIQNITMGDSPAAVMMVGDRAMFALLPGDAADPGVALDAESEAVRLRLADALEADRVQRLPSIWLRGAAISLVVLLIAGALLWGLHRAGAHIEDRLRAILLKRTGKGRMSWVEYAIPVLSRVLMLLRWLVYALIALTAITVVLESFPLTRPLSTGVVSFFGDRLLLFGRAVIAAMPGLVTMVLILFLTHAVAQGVALFFENIHSGRIRASAAQRETALATKRLINLLIWGMGIAIAYPYIPGSQSEAFKGLSLFFGLMVSLGSAGVVSQLMSGLVVVYSRALRRGDRVAIQGQEATVIEVGGLATKLININGQEITVPNSVLIGNPIVNYSKMAESGPVYLSAMVTIGYDAPWRQVHRILLDAAAATEGFAKTPAPFVLQRALSDYYAEYELLVALEDPKEGIRRKPHLMSALHANIQDSFNAAGVQIMSPHFVAQPDAAVVVPREQWEGITPAPVTPLEVARDIVGQPPGKPD